MIVRELTPDDAEAFYRIRHEGLRDTPMAFAASPEDDRASSVEATRELLDAGPSTIFGAFDPELVGVVGAVRNHHLKMAHKLHVWGVYVSPAGRGRGIGEALLRAVIAYAEEVPGIDWLQLSVSSTTPAAKRLYERVGFEVWGIEPDALRYAGESGDELHMARRV
ncbi:MAG: N-acetyltransferase [Planctomycetota bacterium]